jgi:hypothetical protein
VRTLTRIIARLTVLWGLDILLRLAGLLARVAVSAGAGLLWRLLGHAGVPSLLRSILGFIGEIAGIRTLVPGVPAFALAAFLVGTFLVGAIAAGVPGFVQGFSLSGIIGTGLVRSLRGWLTAFLRRLRPSTPEFPRVGRG